MGLAVMGKSAGGKGRSSSDTTCCQGSLGASYKDVAPAGRRYRIGQAG